MRVLWVTNTIFPDFAKSIGGNFPVVGGWMFGLANDLSAAGIELFVATSKQNCEEQQTELNSITYSLFRRVKPSTDYDQSINVSWKNLVQEINPDIVHIHGTEYAHGLSLIKACPHLKYVISIQGLISVYARYYAGSITIEEIKKSSTLRDLMKKDGIIRSKKKFHKRGELVEKQYFKLAQNFIGRTTWDFHHTKALNKKANYHFCNESLRDAFYTSDKWNLSDKTEFSIFLSQALYPIKGLHQVIKAIAFITEDFPNLKIRIAGNNIVKSDSVKQKIALSGYGNYIKKLISKFNLIDKVEFLGYLNETQMVQEYLNCHVFICPSSIENSPNSLGEAQILGTPCIASYVGGIPDMVEHGKTGLLYRFEEVEMLAQHIQSIFTNPTLAKEISANSIIAAERRHNRKANLKATIEIYKKIVAGPQNFD